VLSSYDTIYRCFSADGEFIAGLATGNQTKINHAVADANDIALKDELVADGSLLFASPAYCIVQGPEFSRLHHCEFGFDIFQP